MSIDWAISAFNEGSLWEIKYFDIYKTRLPQFSDRNNEEKSWKPINMSTFNDQSAIWIKLFFSALSSVLSIPPSMNTVLEILPRYCEGPSCTKRICQPKTTWIYYCGLSCVDNEVETAFIEPFSIKIYIHVKLSDFNSYCFHLDYVFISLASFHVHWCNYSRCTSIRVHAFRHV